MGAAEATEAACETVRAVEAAEPAVVAAGVVTQAKVMKEAARAAAVGSVAVAVESMEAMAATRAERPARVERAGQAQPATRQAYQGPAMTQAAFFFPPPNPGSPPSRSCGDYLGVWRRRIEVLSNQEVLSGLTWPEMPGSRSSLHYDHSLIPTFSLQRRTSHSPDQNRNEKAVQRY